MDNWLFAFSLFFLGDVLCHFGIMYALFGIYGYFQRCEKRLDMIEGDEF